MARWLQPPAGLQHLAAANILAQDYARHGVPSEDDKQKLLKLFRSVGGSADQMTTPSSYSMNQPNTDAFLSPELRGELASGILDLHSFDTELLSEDSTSPFLPVIEQGFENESEILNLSKVNGKSQSQFEVSPLRPLIMEKENVSKDGSLAKIRVVIVRVQEEAIRSRIEVCASNAFKVRKRPINKKEQARREDDIINVENSGNSLTVHEPKVKVDLTAYVEKHEFVFDAVLDENVSNEEVYHETVEPIVPTIFQRTKATCFAYGQTGSGKTYTMRPLPLKASQDMLNMMQRTHYKNQGFELWLSFFEIYGGKLYDLLNERSKLCMREDGRQKVCIVGLKEFAVYDVETIKEYIDRGNASRSTGSTGANEESSRSHAILQLSVKKRVDGSDLKPARLVGKFSFIDLAGSERGADTTDNDRQTRLEGAEINKSLLALKECIRALDNDQCHIPFRGSKLTEVLRDSFVGDSRTVMISCVSPNSGSCEHTLNTLRYADRVKGLSKSNLKRDMSLNLPPPRDAAVVASFSSQIQASEIAEDSAEGFQSSEEEYETTNKAITVCDSFQYTRDDRRKCFPMFENNNGSSNISKYESTNGSSNISRYETNNGGSNFSRSETNNGNSNGRYEANTGSSNVSRYENASRYETNNGSSNASRYETNNGGSNVSRYDSNNGGSNVSRYETNNGSSNVSRYETNNGNSNVSRYEMNNGSSNVSRYETNNGSSNVSRYEINNGSSNGSKYETNNGITNGSKYETNNGSLNSSRYEGYASSYQEKSEQMLLPSQKKIVRDEKQPLYANVIDRLHDKANDSSARNLPCFQAADLPYENLQDAPINALLKEEDALVSAHRKEVEGTIELVREEMKLLAEIDQPGSRIGHYVSQLSLVLSRKAAGLVNLQTRLARFQRLLKEQEVVGASDS